MGLGMGVQPLCDSLCSSNMICVVMVLHRAARHGGAEQICIMVVACDGEWQHLPCKLCFGHDGSTGGTPIRLEGIQTFQQAIILVHQYCTSRGGVN